MKFENLFKGKLAENNYSMRRFAEEIGILPQNLSQRVKRGCITYDEAVEFAAKLGYKVEWVRNNENR